MQMRINYIYIYIYTAIYALKEDMDTLYECMRVLSTQQLNPLIMPLDILRKVLDQVKDGIHSNAWLTLSEDPSQNIWAYYNIIKITPIVMDDYLMVILTIPLIDSSLNMYPFKVHNLPMLHPQYEIQVEYELESAYLATHMHGMYVTIPKEMDIKLCMMSQGHSCMFEEPLYSIDKIDWCVYALFINDLTKIEANCRFTTTIRHINLAHSLDAYLLAISSLATEKLQIRCIHQTSVVTTEPPLHIIDIGNGCEAFFSTIYISANSELTATMQSLMRSQFFLNYNFKYSKMSAFLVFHEISFAQLTPEEITILQSKVDTLEPMNVALFNQKFKLINENYPLTLPPWAILGGQIVSGTFILTKISLTAWFCLKHRKSVGTLLKLGVTLTKKICQDPKFIELGSSIKPLDPPPNPPLGSTGYVAPAAKTAPKEHAVAIPSTSAEVHTPSIPS